jgi:hypothetical protein
MDQATATVESYGDECLTGDRKVPSQPAPALERGRFTHGTCPGFVSGRTTWLVLPLVVSVSSGPTWAHKHR